MTFKIATEPSETIDSIFDGILLAIGEESGPALSLNISSLDERAAIATIIHGITAIGMGVNNQTGLFGPIPVPYNDAYRALIYVFSVESKTLDKGRLCSLFLIFKKEMIRFIANVYSMIESLLNVYQETYLPSEDHLHTETIQQIYKELIANLKLKPRKRLFRINNGLMVEYEDSRIKLGNELTSLVDEKEKIIYTYIPKNLDIEVKEKVTKIIKRLNEIEYQNLFTIKFSSSLKSFVSILNKNNISIIE
ncbi:MAG: hypothetical protein JXA54_04100 [Candidatus Heimdallarchaeota archaeon]|nr:hypothetical protein [Candidatus Heimdallarchaeota archaeon]